MKSKKNKERLILKKQRIWLIITTATVIALIVFVYMLSRIYVVNQVEKRVRDMMLECRAFHQYIQKDMHPEYYKLMEEGRLPKGFYAPELLSSSYIARTFQQHYNEERLKAGLPQIHYKMASVNPRNPVNQATDYEIKLIEWFNEDKTRTHYREIIKEDGKKYLLYATPFLAVQNRCLKCHGDPENAPRQLREIYQWEGGYNYKVGDIIAAEFIRSPMEGEYSYAIIFVSGFIFILIIGSVLLIFNSRLRLLVSRRTNDLSKALVKAEESDRLKSAFLANMSHEIRTPMNGIMGFSELLKEQDLSGDEQHACFDIIEKSGNRMLNIINDLISISKIEADQAETVMSSVNINKLNEQLFTFFKPEADIKGLRFLFKNSFSDENANILTDSDKLFTVLSNLIKNAIKYTDNGGIEFAYALKDQFVEFYVKDTGIGIPEEKQKIIFDRFVQGNTSLSSPYEGAGLGLSIAKAYVEMLGGKIWLESNPGMPTSFFFTIPYKPDESQPKKSKVKIEIKENPDEFLGQTLLIVDDVSSSSLYLSAILKYSFKNVLFAKTGKEAIEMCRLHTDIELILMDIKMPDMDGYMATQEIRKFNDSVIIISQTAYALEGDREKSIQAGCNDYIAKPFSKMRLIEIIRKHLK